MSGSESPEPTAPQEQSEPVTEGTESETDQDAARRKFREALDRKKVGHHGQGAATDPKSRAPHASPAKPQRTFRRKSG